MAVDLCKNKSDGFPRKVKPKIMYYLYMLTCADRTLYIGITTDINRRMKEHNTSKLGAKYTRTRRPVQLVYSKEFADQSEAQKEENKIKKLSRAEKLKLIARNKFVGFTKSRDSINRVRPSALKLLIPIVDAEEAVERAPTEKTLKKRDPGNSKNRPIHPDNTV